MPEVSQRPRHLRPLSLSEEEDLDDRRELALNEQNILRLFTSPRSRACTASNRRNGIYLRTASVTRGKEDEWMRFTGLKSVLRTHFYPSYDYEASMRNNNNNTGAQRSGGRGRGRQRRRRRGRQNSNIVHEPLGGSSCFASAMSSSEEEEEEEDEDDAESETTTTMSRGRWGMRRGTQVDRQLTRIANMEWKHPTEDEASIFVRVLDSMGRSGMPHPMTVAIMKKRREWGWKRLVSQFPVYWEGALIASAIDCIHTAGPENRLVLEETKTGFARYLTRSNDRMHASSPMRDQPNHPLNQHLLQLLLCKMMLERLWDATVHEAYVVQAVSATVVQRHAIPPWMLLRQDEIWDYLLKERRKKFGDVVLSPLAVHTESEKKKRY